MSVRARQVTDWTWLNDAQGMMQELPVAVGIAGREAFNDAQGAFLQDLRAEPGPVGKGKKQWNSRLQQQAYFASNGFGGGIPSVRSGKLAKAWIVEQALVGESWKVFVSNPFKAARFVYGSLALSDPIAAARFQQRMHAITGWPLIVLLVRTWFDLLQEEFTGNMNIMIGELGTPTFKRRGITPRLPKPKRR